MSLAQPYYCILLSILLFLVSTVFSTVYEIPPISDAMDSNNRIAPSLYGKYVPDAAKQGYVEVVFRSNGSEYTDNIPVNASMVVASMNLIIDNGTMALEGVSAIIAIGNEMGHLPVVPGADERTPLDLSGTYCNADTFIEISQNGQGWICDFDNDGCAEYENSSVTDSTFEITFMFRNLSRIVTPSSNIVPVPQDILRAMEDSSGLENLSVWLNGSTLFTYSFNDRNIRFGVCDDSYYYSAAMLRFSESRNFTVYGNDSIFFLRSPVLREQWHANNRFDVLVPSQNKLYSAQISINGTPLCNYTISRFEIIENRYGLGEINSVPAETEFEFMQNVSGNNLAPLSKENESFGFIYEFDCPYDGIGENNLSITINGMYGQMAHKERIISRMLSYGGQFDETGGNADADLSRPSIAYGNQELLTIEISAGIIGLLVLLFLANRRFGKRE